MSAWCRPMGTTIGVADRKASGKVSLAQCNVT